MKPKQLKNLLMSKIHNVANNSNLYCMNPKKDFTRKRKLTMEKLIVGIIGIIPISELQQCFQPVTTFSTEQKQRRLKWIQVELLLNHSRQSINGFAHVCVTAGQVDFSCNRDVT